MSRYNNSPVDPLKIQLVHDMLSSPLVNALWLEFVHHRVCHQFQPQCGFVRLIYLYPNLLKILNNKGWELENVFGVTKLVRKEA